VDRVALGQVFSEYFGFPCLLEFHQLLHFPPLSLGAGIMGHITCSFSPRHKKTTAQSPSLDTDSHHNPEICPSLSQIWHRNASNLRLNEMIDACVCVCVCVAVCTESKARVLQEGDTFVGSQALPTRPSGRGTIERR
jgi:hypothetical protein